MNERFTIIDYTTDSAGVSTVIDEPVGWDAIALRMKRDKVWHGFFDFVDDSVASLEFVSDGFSILKTAYEAFGAQAKCELLIEYQCAEGDDYETLYLGRFVFSEYKDECGDLCKATIGVEALDCLMVFRNRYDQQVDLDSLVTFDDPCEETSGGVVAQFTAAHTITFLGEFNGMEPGTTFTISGSASNDGTFTVVSYSYVPTIATVVVEETVITEAPVAVTIAGCIVKFRMEEYTGLNYPIQLPSKVIRLTNNWGINPEAGGTYQYVDTLLSSEPPGAQGFFVFPFEWDINNVTEITDSDPFRYEFQIVQTGSTPFIDIFRAENDGIIQLNLASAIRCTGETEITLVIGGNIDVESSVDTISFLGTIILAYGNDQLGFTNVTLQSGFGCGGCNTANNAININYNDTINLTQGDRVYIYFVVANMQYLSGPTGVNPFTIDITIDSASLVVVTDTQCEPTVANVYKVNEVMSRCVEAYTNDCMRVYSDYFGRTDAQPYPSDVNGCGGQRSIANGKKIRNAPTSDPAIPIKMTVSMKDTFEALNATDNIGMGLEEDPFRNYGYGGGYKLLRVEPVNYFFNNDVLMVCDHIRKVERDVDSALIYSIFKGGYSKHETWNANGLYDIFADRQYRTELSELSNTLDQTCKWLASDYAIEYTRRLYGTTTSDWRYDDDIFFICFMPCFEGAIRFNINEGTPDEYFITFFGISGNQAEVGDVITITGTTSNDGTYTVTAVLSDGGDSVLEIQVAEAVVDELDFEAGACNETTPFTIVETGLDNPANILFPETVMNYRIAPSRNAMRWFKTILQSYRTFEGKNLIFTQGGGNILAEGEVLDDDGCRLENQVIQEQEDIDLDLFNYQELNVPKFYPELIKFEYPMSYAQYKVVKDNPYGLIGYQCGSAEVKYGWIEDMQYSPYQGIVNFVLRPKISTDDCDECILSEFDNGLLAESGEEIIIE